ncbi:hypothetical protein HDV64DRAFT_243668 [Trichoderma sp. TUCIM 5745]
MSHLFSASNATLYRRAGPKSQGFGGISAEEFSDDRSSSRRLSRNRTLLVVTFQLRPCVLCVYRSEQPISLPSSPLLSGFGSALTLASGDDLAADANVASIEPGLPSAQEVALSAAGLFLPIALVHPEQANVPEPPQLGQAPTAS